MDGIVVGLDGSDSSKAALRWAIAEARLRGSAVSVVDAWTPAPAAYAPGFLPAASPSLEELPRAAEDMIRAAVAEALEGADDVEVTPVAVEGSAAATLIEASDGADLLVVGSRGHGGFAGLLLGSVSTHCVHHARCPVVVVRGAD